MITTDGYSKDTSIIPEGVAITFGRNMIAEKGGLRKFLKWFEDILATEDGYFLQKCKNCPAYADDLVYVYVIICNRVYYRCYFGGYQRGETSVFLHPGSFATTPITWPRIVLGGPVVKAKQRIVRRGFQGFRYTTKLF